MAIREAVQVFSVVEDLLAANAALRRVGREQGARLAELIGRKLERLEAENAALRELVSVVADGADWPDHIQDVQHCAWCSGETLFSDDTMYHTADCPVTKARTLLEVSNGNH
jgi:hypothetical protein